MHSTTIKNNGAPAETRGSTRPEDSGTDEAGENDLKNNFMKMIEALKEE